MVKDAVKVVVVQRPQSVSLEHSVHAVDDLGAAKPISAKDAYLCRKEVVGACKRRWYAHSFAPEHAFEVIDEGVRLYVRFHHQTHY